MALIANANSCEEDSNSLLQSETIPSSLFGHFKFEADSKGKPKTSDVGGVYTL